jgi:hypothetical protein
MSPAQPPSSLSRAAETPSSAVHDALDSVAIPAAAPIFDMLTNT